MNYSFLKDVLDLIQDFETQNLREDDFTNDITGFRKWIFENAQNEFSKPEPYWEGKENGRSAESAINTLIVHMNRYAKTYSKAAILDSKFSTQEDFIYLINLKAFGAMTKMELIKKNIQEKPVGMQIINRLIRHGWVVQKDSKTDKRSKVISITPKGIIALEEQMDKIRDATKIVTGNLTHDEKMELIRLLNKLDYFHNPIYSRNIESKELLETALHALNNDE